MKKILTTLILLVFLVQIKAQTAPNKYWVEFKNKTNSPYQVNNPLSFLSQRAIDRRLRMNIQITSQDFPVNSWYLDSIQQTGANVLTTSRWHNGATFYTTDTAVVTRISNMSFVRNIQKTNAIKSKSKKQNSQVILPIDKNQRSLMKINQDNPSLTAKSLNSFNYGFAFPQISMIKGDYLHQMGFSGEGMLIGVLDAGFFQADVLPAFDSLWLNNQIIGYQDFVNPNSNIFQESSHGMMVLSIMGGNIADSLVGTAPKASYLLLRSEDAPTENLVEEDNWVAAIEFADSVGVDVVNSSLGYTTFDDTTIVRTFADMNGRVSRASLAATYAGRRGMILCISAGNSALNPWHHIGVPTDADSILSVGAVDAFLYHASFSSVGPAADGRVKPDVAAMGQGTYVQDIDGRIISGNGTSFSSPVLAGSVACLWQAFPNKSNFEIMDAIRKSGNQYNNPDTLLGYGVPNFMIAYQSLMSVSIPSIKESQENFMVYPNPLIDNQSLYISFYSPQNCNANVVIYNNMGKIQGFYQVDNVLSGENKIQLLNSAKLSSGVYYIKILSSGFSYTNRFIKSSTTSN